MRKSVLAVALLTLPLMAGCGSDEKAAAPTTSVVATSTAVTATSSGSASTTPAASNGATATTSGAAGGGLSAAEISKNLQDKGHVDQKTADCIAKIYVEEGLSQNGIRKLIDAGNGSGSTVPTGLSADDLMKAAKATKRVVTECSK
ncbi:hypothetical protein AB0N05_18515 [Nocardia sp. NPDC051030]|uniref:hypothetical protein n=1 Tax=Nocardia sp. NPDC051030 TaxID=3155162 RepID=UPI003419EAA6